MTLADAVAAFLPDARAEAEALMLDAGTARRETGTSWDPVEQADTPDYEDLFSSRCKIQARRLVAQDEEVGARTATSIRLELHLPIDTAPLTTGDEWVLTTPGALSTVPAGTVYRVTAPAEGSLKTARRYEIERVTN